MLEENKKKRMLRVTCTFAVLRGARSGWPTLLVILLNIQAPKNRVMEVMIARFTQETPETPMLRWGKAGGVGGRHCGDFVGMNTRSFRRGAIWRQ